MIKWIKLRILAIQKFSKGNAYLFAEYSSLAFLLICLIPTLRNITEENDINIFYKAAESLRAGQSMYAKPHLYGMWYYYSPLFATILVPFTYFPMQVVKLVWWLLGLLLIRRIQILTFQFLGIEKGKKNIPLLLILTVCSLHPIFMNLLYGQLTIFIVWCCLEGAIAFSNKREWKGALLFGLGINFKLLPLFFLFYYFIKSNYKFLIKIVTATVLFIVLPYLFIEFQFHTDLLVQWKSMINPLNDEHINTAGEGGFTDFASIITKYFTSIAISTEGQFNIARLTEYEVFLIQTGYRLFILILCAWFVLRFKKINGIPENVKIFSEISFILLCTISAFPHQRDYSVMLAVPAFLLLLYTWFCMDFRPPKALLIYMGISAIGMGFLLFPQLLTHDIKYFFYEKRIPGIFTILFTPGYFYWIWLLRKATGKKMVE
ncbi:MAG: DUF2029 domain-containing protein [Bacteroidetes bacterium]|nr:DUF2029 domain-containing protein [Bacteroidota bacterium]